MKKFIVVISVVLLLFITSSYVYTHFDELKNYWSNEDWKLVEVLETIPVSNYYNINGTNSNLVVVGNNYVHGYSADGKENFDMNVSLKDAITSTSLSTRFMPSLVRELIPERSTICLTTL